MTRHPVFVIQRVSVGDGQTQVFVTAAVKRPAGQQREGNLVALIFLLFRNAKRSSRNLNVETGCRGILRTPGDVLFTAWPDSRCCTLVALSSTKPQKSFHIQSKKGILKRCVDLKFDLFLCHQFFFSLKGPAFNSMYKRIFT